MKVITKTISVLAVAVASVVGFSAPAQAADAYAYVVVNNNVCPSGSQVRGILLNDAQSGYTATSWDNGDNIAYPRVRLGVRNQLSIQVRCDKKVALFFWQPTGFRTVVAYVVPTRAGQTFWVG
ncbi:hypothetical protein ACIPYU_19645 [Paenarthrobacter nicotinovorans]|uniref:hypothetical protein n=1 Tax=Paenarthrobacter nicotinovorans TaxID=29320 RepID=UPI0038052405